MSYYIHVGEFFLENRTENGGYLGVQYDGNFGLCYREDEKLSHGLIKEYSNQWIAPGYVDTYTHGLFDEGTMKSDWEGVNKVSEGLSQAGVTNWLPTTITASDKESTETCEKLAVHKGEETGAKIQGLHFEGPPFIPEHDGTEDPKYMTDPSIMFLEKWRKASDDTLIKILMAPERKDARQFVCEVAKTGLVVALGHPDSDFGDAIVCVEAGASVFIHTFSGMDGLSQHSPNIIGAAFLSRLTTDELICDGYRVEEPTVRALVNVRGSEHITLIIDCMQAGLMSDGDYILGGLPAYVKDGMARLKDTNNSVGSILPSKDTVKNIVDWNVTTPEDAVMMASYVPAKSCNLLDKCGAIKSDHPAGFVVLNHDATVSEAYLNGELRYKAQKSIPLVGTLEILKKVVTAS